ncbi:hypothetical protein CF326_g7694 [Tilletia indica]|nr:hypothetical protein CF326_g7694 [Tilletia indica]
MTGSTQPADRERDSRRDWVGEQPQEYGYRTAPHRPLENSRNWDMGPNTEENRRRQQPYDFTPDPQHRFEPPEIRQASDRFDQYPLMFQHDRPPPRRYSPSPPRPSPPPPPTPRSVPVQLRLVKLVSDVLPAHHNVAVLDSDYTGSGAEDGVSVGRDRVFTRRIRLTSMDVSKHHATIFRTAGLPTSVGGDGGWWIVDNGSAHGTFVLQLEKRVKNGDAGSGAGGQQQLPLAQATASDPPLSAYHRLSEAKVASRPSEVRHGDLIRIGKTILEVHLHSSPTRARPYPRGYEDPSQFTEDDRQHPPHHHDLRSDGAAACCEICQIDFDGTNSIPLLVKDDAQSKTQPVAPGRDISASQLVDSDGSYASGAARLVAGDRKLDSDAEWKRKMKDLRGIYLDTGKGKGKTNNTGEGSSGAAGVNGGITAAGSWKKNLSTKKKRAAADDGIMVSIPTAHLHRVPTTVPTTTATSSNVAEASTAPESFPSNAPGSEAEPSTSTSAQAPRYVDRAAQRRLHAHSIEKTLPRGALNELSGSGPDPQYAARMAAAAIPLPALVPPPSELAAPKATASTPLAENNRGFKLFSAMSGGGSSTPTAGGSGTGEDHGSLVEAPQAQHRQHEPIIARGTSGRAGLGTGSLMGVDEIAAAGRQLSWQSGGNNATYAEYSREAAKRRWQESGQQGGS